MQAKKNILAIIGSASENSSNEKLIDLLITLTDGIFTWTVFKKLKSLPHFDPELSANHPPQPIIDFRAKIDQADGVIICTPEYVFSIPSGLKNAIEWCVATTVFSNKLMGLITASADGQKGHEELQLVMKTVMANFTDKTTLLIQGIKGKINEQGQLTDEKTKREVLAFMDEFERIVKEII